jgi:hypothetical protein
MREQNCTPQRFSHGELYGTMMLIYGVGFFFYTITSRQLCVRQPLQANNYILLCFVLNAFHYDY